MSTRPKIDEVDVRILKILLNDVRTSFAEIAKDCGMSTNAIRMRFKRLKKDGVINGAIMQVNPKSLGYDCIALLTIQADANEEKSVYDFVEKIPGIITSSRPFGKYNILSFSASRSIDELASLVEQINSNLHVNEVQENIWFDVVRMDRPENLVIEPFDGLLHTNELLPKDQSPKPSKTPLHIGDVAEENHLEESYKLDKIDLSIIKILSGNARMSFRKIAKQLDISTQSVIKRYKKMRKEVLPYSSITLDLRKFGYIGIALFFIKTSHEHVISDTFNRILRVPNVIVAYRCLGTIDIVATAPFKNYKQLFKVKHEISKILCVKQVEVYIDKPLTSWPLNLFTQLLPS
jgi:DNA-binding Lrp family transcriptional regulator